MKAFEQTTVGAAPCRGVAARDDFNGLRRPACPDATQPKFSQQPMINTTVLNLKASPRSTTATMS